MLGCTTGLRPPDRFGPDAIAALAADAGFQALALIEGCRLDLLPGVVRAAADVGLAVPMLAAPMTEGPLGPGKRLPYLAAIEDKDERLAALALLEKTISAGRDVGASRYLIDLGPAPLTIRQAAFRDAFDRAQLDEGEPGHRIFRDALAERRSIAPRLMDAARGALERASRLAEAGGVELVLGFATTPWGLPSPREALQLLGELTGAPMGLAFEPARWAVIERLGLEGPPGRRADLQAVATVHIAADAVGLTHDLIPGSGELPDDAWVWTKDDKKTSPSIFVKGRSDTTEHELARARERFGR